MRILVTGASGLLGLNLALSAAADSAQEHIVFGTVKDHALKTDAFTVIQTDLLLPGAVERLLDQARGIPGVETASLSDRLPLEGGSNYYVQIRGRVVEITPEGADAHIDALSDKYTGNPKYQGRSAGQQRITYKILPSKASTMG